MNHHFLKHIKNKTMETGKLRRMMAIGAIVACFALASCDKNDDDNNNNNRSYTISGNASGSQMVPSVAGNGSGTISGTYDPNTRMLTYNSGWSGLTGAPTSAGFYTGATGVSGSAVGSPWTLGSNLTGTGTFSGSTTLTTEQADQLTSGNMYYSYGTAANSGGEVRGQITATR
jgi:hypothetical protein